MGQSTPTTTMAIDTFEERYASFRAELSPRERAVFDELVCRARRHSNAINRRPHLDFERPVFLSMLLETLEDLHTVRRELEAMEGQLKEVCDVLEDAGLVVRRIPRRAPELLDRMGQTRLHGRTPARPVSP